MKYFRYPTQKEWQRKEELYLKIIQYLEKGKQWEHAIPLCKELSHIYEHKVFDYTKLSSILKRQSALYEKVISTSEDTLRLDPEYFRVGFYGTGFPLFLRVSFLLFLDKTTPIDLCIYYKHKVLNAKISQETLYKHFLVKWWIYPFAYNLHNFTPCHVSYS